MLLYYDMVAFWGHMVRPHHHGWIWGSPLKGLDMFAQCFIQVKDILEQKMETCQIGFRLAKGVFSSP